jgi:3-methyl-2-oxobutanoate hydroxymethyltransferase
VKGELDMEKKKEQQLKLQKHPTNHDQKKKIGLLDLQKMKKENIPVAWITAYDLPFAYVAEQAGVDMILVGDSGGMVQLGYKTTNPVTMDEMIFFSKAVRRGAPQTFIIGDMPQGSYEPSERDAVINALRFVKEAGCDAIKCEGGKRVSKQMKAICDAGILVMGHLGLTPQSTPSFGGYRVQGKTVKSFESAIEDAFELQSVGAFAILLEAMPSEPAGQITKQLNIPIYGIGAGNLVDGQLVIMHDLVGFFQPFRPWFAKCYIPDVVQNFGDYISRIDNLKELGRTERRDGLLFLAEMAVRRYCEDVRNKKFPSSDYIYPIKEEDLCKLKRSKYWK